MKSLYELAVSVRGPGDIDDPLHCEITIEPAVATALGLSVTEADQDRHLRAFGSPDDEALREAGRHLAGILGRVATALSPWLDYTRKEHRCVLDNPILMWDGEPTWWESCHISGSGVLNPAENEYWQPALWITVPASERAAWLTRIRDALEVIAAEGP